jgi:hypothetical protein
MPFKFEMASKPSGLRADKQHMKCVLHDQACSSDRMDNALNGGYSAGLQALSFHDRCIHPLHAIELQLGSVPGIKEPTVFEHSDGLLDGKECRATSFEPRIADLQCSSQASALW